MDKGKLTVSVFLNWVEAFDSIDRSILMKKLECYSVRGHGLMLIKRYFSDRL